MKNTCFVCKKTKEITEFQPHKSMKSGYLNKCILCHRAYATEYRNNHLSKTREYDVYRDRYHVERIFRKKYTNIKIRSTQKVKGKKLSCHKKEFVEKTDWLKWCYEKDNYNQFLKLYQKWVNSNFSRKLNPSIDRIDNNKGYELGNLQWITQSENASKGNRR